jgi:hypothetical protein
MLVEVEVDLEVGLDVEFNVALEQAKDTLPPPDAPRELTPVMLTPSLDSRRQS